MARLVGWREWINLPDLGVDRIKVKVDSGARTSALHAFNLQAFQQDDQEWVTFSLHPLQENTQVEVPCRALVKEHRIVRDSGGHEETRVVIETNVTLGDESWPIELTLTDRENMGFRMLLGRNAVKGLFYIDPTQSFLLSSAESTDGDFHEEEEELEESQIKRSRLADAYLFKGQQQGHGGQHSQHKKRALRAYKTRIISPFEPS